MTETILAGARHSNSDSRSFGYSHTQFVSENRIHGSLEVKHLSEERKVVDPISASGVDFSSHSPQLDFPFYKQMIFEIMIVKWKVFIKEAVDRPEKWAETH